MVETKIWLRRCLILCGAFVCAARIGRPGIARRCRNRRFRAGATAAGNWPRPRRASLRSRANRPGSSCLLDGRDAAGNVRDLTRDAQFEIAPAGIVTVDATGVVRPVSTGTAQITAVHPSGLSAATKVVVENAEHDLPINFPTQVVPIFTKAGCNAGGCHGKSGGQNGFALSLLGFEPAEDYEYIVQEARGRRISVAAPDQSLLLLKATGAVPHGGGKRLTAGESSYEVIRRWIAAGAPPGDPNVKRVAAIEVLPAERIMPRNSQQQLVVIAHYTDGTTEDVSELAQYKLSEPDMAEVNETGLVKTGARPGDVAVMVSYQSHVAVFRAILPLGAPLEVRSRAAEFCR